MEKSSHLEAAIQLLKAAVEARASSKGELLSWVEIKTIATAEMGRYAKTFTGSARIAEFIAENSDIMKQVQHYVGPDGTPLWELVQGNIASFLNWRLANTLQELFAAQFDNDFDPIENLKTFGHQVANAWEQRVGDNHTVQGQITMLRQQLAADDLSMALASLHRVVTSGGSLRHDFSEALELAAAAYASRDAFTRVREQAAPKPGM